MDWIPLTSDQDFEKLLQESEMQPQVIFKHSTRCSISSMAKSRIDKTPSNSTINFHYLDLITYRALSNKISEHFSVYHESPQVLLIKNGTCVYDESHLSIYPEEIIEAAN
jgi:bacillithiol system protein YtxJ